ncbi:MAG: lysine-sensitive aspartokinase 3 [Acidobacteria bacterium]|nr:lysine-sensitive aspartokinase 3 [Acidobacteriota bacterium]
MIVMKFGGTSVEDARAIVNVIEIVKRDLDKAPVLVISAIAGATNTLIELANMAAAGREKDALAVLKHLQARHAAIVDDLELTDTRRKSLYAQMDSYVGELRDLVRGIVILGELTNRSLDTFCSYGERLSTQIVAAAMIEREVSAELVDARRFMITDDNFSKAGPLLEQIEPLAQEVLFPLAQAGFVPVTQGYIGATRQGITTTLGRGGSDYSAAIIGAALSAEDIQIWTDVDGVLTADPRLVKTARRVTRMSFAEASELSYFGSKVLHPSTIVPAIRKNIPVHVYNSRKPYSTGTLITSSIPKSIGFVKSIAYKRGVTVVNVYSARMLLAYGFMKLIFDVFDRYKTSVDLVSTSEVSVSITVDNTDQIQAIANELEAIAKVSVVHNKAIVCIVGEQLKYTPGIVGRVFRAIDDVNIDMISQGASDINLSFVVDEADVEHVVNRLHEELFAHAEEDVFE